MIGDVSTSVEGYVKFMVQEPRGYLSQAGSLLQARGDQRLLSIKRGGDGGVILFPKRLRRS